MRGTGSFGGCVVIGGRRGAAGVRRAGLGAALLLIGACGPEESRYQIADGPLAGWSGPQPIIALRVEGPRADPEKGARCRALMSGYGAHLDPTSESIIVIHLEGNDAEIESRGDGQSVHEPDHGFAGSVAPQDV